MDFMPISKRIYNNEKIRLSLQYREIVILTK